MQIEPISKLNINHGATDRNYKNEEKTNSSKNAGYSLFLSLVGLATLGIATIGLVKTSKITFEEALKKKGVQLNEGVATLIDSGKKFTGKIERFESRNKKETVEFVDGIVTERIYHNILGKELEGEFYKDGKCILWIKKATEPRLQKRGFIYSNSETHGVKPASFIETKDGFNWAREYIKNHKNC